MHQKKRVILLNRQPKNTSVEWLLNLLNSIPKVQLESSALRPIDDKQLNIVTESDPLKHTYIYTYGQDKFKTREFLLYPNMLICLAEQDDDKGTPQKIDKFNKKLSSERIKLSFYLILSSCILEKKRISYKEFEAVGLVLSSENGYLYLFFDNSLDHIEVSYLCNNIP